MPPPTFRWTQVVKKATKMKRKTETSVGQGLSEDTKQRISEAYLETPHVFILSIDNFVAFIENTDGSSDPYQEAKKFTNYIESLLSNMHTIYPFLKQRSIKNRITRLYKKIKENLQINEIELGSVSSLMSSAELSDEEGLSDSSQISQKSLH
ncbi:hypothetical protein HHI36_001553 [Cryptolaemus montrouzieri]|uniref:Uncharacterized protein n=1 Tax=Cryptolaemus montrouzieri TaxID=559131 RepID=A0ABD2P897_9CUCU